MNDLVQPDPNTYGFFLAESVLFLADKLKEMEKNTARKKKKEAVVQEKYTLLRKSFSIQLVAANQNHAYADIIKESWDPATQKKFFIDLAFSNPFAPYELKFSSKDFEIVLEQYGFQIGILQNETQSILKTKSDVLKSQKKINWKQIAALGVGGAGILATGGYFFAPILGSALGSAAGLSGAAATAHGLALLGGGSLAMGGAGMAGGIWLVTGAGAALGTVAGGGKLLHELGAATVQGELIKLQTTFKELYLPAHDESDDSEIVIVKLKNDLIKMKEKLAVERKLNEENSNRIAQYKAKIYSIQSSIKWMQNQIDSELEDEPNTSSPDLDGLLSIHDYNQLVILIPESFSPKDRLPISLSNGRMTQTFYLSQIPYSLVIFLAMERANNGARWLDNISDHTEELMEIFSRLDFIDRNDPDIDYSQPGAYINDWPSWVINRDESNRKNVVSRINKEVRKVVNGKLVMSTRSINSKGTYTLAPTITEISL